MGKTELMAPAGNMECLRAALEAGADSIYFGLKEFNARAAADNFSEEEMQEAICLIHGEQKKAYLTLNILIKEQEMSAAVECAVKAINAGIDAIIVQDIGLAKILMKYHVPVIASTQLTIGNHIGAEILKQWGFSRVVLARELNVDEIADIGHKVDGIELECFVHGGLCISYSGQCNASCIFESTAANRGICGTPCWDNYTLYQNGIEIRSGKLIKPKDMFGIEHLRELAESGISAFKIQGRTRTRKYVKNIVSTYKKYVDIVNHGLSFHVEEKDMDELKKNSSRGIMRGNLERTVNDNFVVAGKEKEIPLKLQNHIWNFEKCQVPRNLTLKLNEIKHEKMDELAPVFARIYIPYDAFVPENKESIAILSKKAPVYMVMPIVFERHLRIYERVEALIAEYSISGISLSNISDLSLISRFSIAYSAEQSLNVMNHDSADMLAKQGIENIVLSLGMNEKECCELAEKLDIQTERVIFGRPELMQMKYCVLRAANECPAGCSLCDTKAQYHLAGKNIYIANINKSRTETILRSEKRMALPVLKHDVAYLRMECTDESVDTINEIAKKYMQGYYPVGDFINETGSR